MHKHQILFLMIFIGVMIVSEQKKEELPETILLWYPIPIWLNTIHKKSNNELLADMLELYLNKTSNQKRINNEGPYIDTVYESTHNEEDSRNYFSEKETTDHSLTTSTYNDIFEDSTNATQTESSNRYTENPHNTHEKLLRIGDFRNNKKDSLNIENLLSNQNNEKYDDDSPKNESNIKTLTFQISPQPNKNENTTKTLMFEIVLLNNNSDSNLEQASNENLSTFEEATQYSTLETTTKVNEKTESREVKSKILSNIKTHKILKKLVRELKSSSVGDSRSEENQETYLTSDIDLTSKKNKEIMEDDYEASKDPTEEFNETNKQQKELGRNGINVPTRKPSSTEEELENIASKVVTVTESILASVPPHLKDTTENHLAKVVYSNNDKINIDLNTVPNTDKASVLYRFGDISQKNSMLNTDAYVQNKMTCQSLIQLLNTLLRNHNHTAEDKITFTEEYAT